MHIAPSMLKSVSEMNLVTSSEENVTLVSVIRVAIVDSLFSYALTESFKLQRHQKTSQTHYEHGCGIYIL